jgi:hypothetical protein
METCWLCGQTIIPEMTYPPKRSPVAFGLSGLCEFCFARQQKERAALVATPSPFPVPPVRTFYHNRAGELLGTDSMTAWDMALRLVAARVAMVEEFGGTVRQVTLARGDDQLLSCTLDAALPLPANHISITLDVTAGTEDHQTLAAASPKEERDS